VVDGWSEVIGAFMEDRRDGRWSATSTSLLRVVDARKHVKYRNVRKGRRGTGKCSTMVGGNKTVWRLSSDRNVKHGTGRLAGSRWTFVLRDVNDVSG
jgi:hypothetical protein